MITLEDCIGMCGLTEEEVLAIAEHEHLPEVAATALAQYLLSREHGSEDIRDMIVEDIRQAQLSPRRGGDAASVRFRHPILPSPYGSGLGPRIWPFEATFAFTVVTAR